MQINVSTRHGHLSSESRARIVRKVEKLERYFERLTSIEVTVDLEHEESPTVDLRVSAEHKHDFVATGRASTLAASLDVAIGKLEQQLRKYKEKVQNRHRTSGRGAGEVPSLAEREAPDVDAEDEEI
ncbi:MAG: ribosome-associated translation inhibitor RaiA [Planctomycetota bacterium]|nr:MAG: ribosome-associated translation inhibitor RaiA [Planctomycetota bacterium]REJ94063.1 MAG: ribosome-associated translation inhibitor RaiA [Planctomycetota bacterium]REK17843.1 MAG: ribosome-associated translation inhibitor RaiA [Planctomycetota bacterium]REK42384.1 MAG: ribosome-associated translation inhibitor RaiA [Planctomycetota bacterium]